MARYGLHYILPSACICVSYYIYTQINQFWKTRRVKTTVPVPFLGKILELCRFSTIQTCSLIYSSFPEDKYVGVMYTTKPVLLVRNPSLVHGILKDDDSFQSRGNMIDKNDFMSKSILFVEGKRWETLHDKLTQIFRKDEMPKYFYLVNVSVENFVKKLEEENGKLINMHDLLSKLYQNIVLILFIGDFTKILNQKVDINKRFNCLNSSKFEKNVFLGSVYPCWFSMFRTNLLSKTGEYFRKIVGEVIEFRDSNSYAREDALQSFLNVRGGEKAHAQLDEDYVFDNDAVIAQSLTMLLMGKDTMANTTAFCLYELAGQTDMQDRLGRELAKVMKKHKGLDSKALLQMDYLRQVVAETLRKYPSVPVFTRACTKEYKEYEGELLLQPGDVIVVPVHSIQNDPEYFQLPEVFMPERFSAENKEKIQLGTYLPFGHGSKQCIAQDLALMQIYLVISRILANFEIVSSKKLLKMNTSSFISSPKNGVWLKLLKKEKPILSP